eukprot:gnl/TRDRNA2_/TRDRNA2_205143_c0_seq1.p1 gnl/TRDRNA2_/TRDRNA2_205143_c0~~gnl/TRDRNA2_/TRDRNA2_205143_c0_seq1.p1  ORF type:complete len:253 (+),score=30.85 gnl/TRDRNA2_/TRDRNA2_205143_c0_seq1:259-1017(+)
MRQVARRRMGELMQPIRASYFVQLAARDASDDRAVGRQDIAQGSAAGSATAGELESWRLRIDRSIAESRKIRGGNFVQIATVSEEGLPTCRTVVFRGFTPTEPSGGSPQALRMITDARSEKVAHIQRSPSCEMVWWFSQSSEQYRIAGKLQLVGPEDAGDLQTARQEQWVKLSDKAREQFWWDMPGIAYSGEQTVPSGGRGSDGEILPPPDAFLLLLLWPQRVKYLRLTDNLAGVDEYESAEGKWTTFRVNP